MNKSVEKRIDDNLERACRILRDQADAMKQRMIECEEKVAFADKDQQNKKISFEIKYVEPDFKNIDASKLIGDIIITENVTTIVSGAASSEISDRAEIGRRKFFELKNSKDCKFLYACADVTVMKSDVLLVFVDWVTKTNPILDHILKNAGEQVRKEFSQSVLFNFPYLESSMYTKAGSLPARRIYYIVTDSGISRQSEHELYDYIIKKLENIFKDYKWSGSRLTSLTVSLDYGKHLQWDDMKFAGVLNNAIINHLLDLNCERFNVNFLTDCGSFVDLMASKMQSLINMDNDREIKFRSGTCLQLSSKNLFDLKVDALMVIADYEFNLFTDLGLKVKKIAGTDFENEIVDKLKNLGRRTVLVTEGHSSNYKNILLCRSPVVYKDNIQSLKSFMKETSDIVREKNLESLAMPLLGTGGFGLLVHQCLEILCENFSENFFGRVFISIPIENKEHTTKCENYLLRADPYLKMKKLKWSVERASSLDFDQMNENRMKDGGSRDRSDISKHEIENEETRCDALESGNGREDDEIEENCSKNLETAKKYYWCYLVRGKRTKYPPKINEVLERNFRNQAPKTKWAESGKIFVVDFGKMKETVIKMTKNKNMDDGGKEKRDNDEKGEDDEKGDDDEKGVDEDDDEEEIDVERVAEDDGWVFL